MIKLIEASTKKFYLNWYIWMLFSGTWVKLRDWNLGQHENIKAITVLTRN